MPVLSMHLEADVLSTEDRGGKSMAKVYTDNLTGTPLDTPVVDAAIVNEPGHFEENDVWKLVPEAEARRIIGKLPITVRWVYS